jgi:hypothetical protein
MIAYGCSRGEDRGGSRAWDIGKRLIPKRMGSGKAGARRVGPDDYVSLSRELSSGLHRSRVWMTPRGTMSPRRQGGLGRGWLRDLGGIWETGFEGAGPGSRHPTAVSSQNSAKAASRSSHHPRNRSSATRMAFVLTSWSARPSRPAAARRSLTTISEGEGGELSPGGGQIPVLGQGHIQILTPPPQPALGYPRSELTFWPLSPAPHWGH